MDETRDFPTAVIASITTGTLLCEFSEMHEAAEYLMGHPIWTHHFASKDLNAKMVAAVLEQCPGLPTKAEGVDRNTWPAFKEKLESEFGPLVKIRKGSGATAMSPLDGIPAHLKDSTVVIETDKRR